MIGVSPVMIITAFLFAAAIGDPDFSGSWKLNPNRSEILAPLSAVDKLFKIDHQGKQLHCLATQEDGKAPVTIRYTIDGKEGESKLGETVLRTILKWEGSALLINSLVNGPDASYTQMDRWKLSRDGKTLTIRRQVVNRHSETESTLVYDKQ